MEEVILNSLNILPPQKIYPSSIPSELVSVQPMATPQSPIFYMKWRDDDIYAEIRDKKDFELT